MPFNGADFLPRAIAKLADAFFELPDNFLQSYQDDFLPAERFNEGLILLSSNENFAALDGEGKASPRSFRFILFAQPRIDFAQLLKWNFVSFPQCCESFEPDQIPKGIDAAERIMSVIRSVLRAKELRAVPVSKLTK